MKRKLFLLAIILLGINCSVFAQTDDEEDGPEPPPPASINHFLPLLLVAGVVLALKKVKVAQNE